jgi:RNA polymerase sigma-70 factor (ECF subfamily)
VTVRTARRRLRVRRLKGFMGLDTPTTYESAASTDASPEERALVARLYAILDRLPANQRIAWTLRRMEGHRLDTVAEICGCSLATAKRYVVSAQTVIQEALSDG